MSEVRKYQVNYSSISPEAMYDSTGRLRKAKTIVSVIEDNLDLNLNSLSLVDVGCSTGIIANYLAQHFKEVTGIDIDKDAIEFAQENFTSKNLRFLCSDSLKMEFPSDTFDIAVCTQVYEHVPDAQVLIQDIYRILKPGGLCYFAAGNRIRVIEPHYHLPLLSVIPRPIAHVYVKLSGKAKYYHEKHLSYWGLRKLVKDFTLVDYTRKIVDDPVKFHAEYMIRPGTAKAALAKLLLKYAYWLCPSYIWLLKKPFDNATKP